MVGGHTVADPVTVTVTVTVNVNVNVNVNVTAVAVNVMAVAVTLAVTVAVAVADEIDYSATTMTAADVAVVGSTWMQTNRCMVPPLT